MPRPKEQKTRLMLEVERRHGGQIETLVITAYNTTGSERAAAQQLGIPRGTLKTWMKKLQLKYTPTVAKE